MKHSPATRLHVKDSRFSSFGGKAAENVKAFMQNVHNFRSIGITLLELIRCSVLFLPSRRHLIFANRLVAVVFERVAVGVGEIDRVFAASPCDFDCVFLKLRF